MYSGLFLPPARAATTARHGAGLVLALLALVVVTAGLAGGWQAWASLRQVRSQHTDADRLRCLLLAGEDLARDWCRRQGERMISPAPDGFLLLADDHLNLDGDLPVHLTVEVRDAYAGLPAHLVGKAKPLATLKPPAWTSAEIPALPPARPGQANDALDRIEVPPGLARFPGPPGTPGRELALACWLGTSSDGRVNVNTVAPDLLADLLTRVGRGDADLLIDLRRQGLRLALSQQAEGPAGRVDGLLLTDRSDTWNVRVQATWGRQSRTWWTLIHAGNRGPQVVQRHELAP